MPGRSRSVPRDRAGTFEPRLIPNHERRFTGFDDQVLALYARGMTVREIQAFLAELYAVEVSPDLMSPVTDAGVAEITAGQGRPLEPMYPVVFFEAWRVTIRAEATVRRTAIDLAVALRPDGGRDLLGIWIEQTEGATFWMKVFSDFKTRGGQDLLIAVTDGLKGLSEALVAVYPAATLQPGIVHLLRHSLDVANWTERKPLAAVRRPIYTAASAEAAGAALDAGARGPWGPRVPTVVASWRRAWTHVVPFFAVPPDVRRVIDTTHALERVHARLRTIIKTRGHVPNDEAATTWIWLAWRTITATWGNAAHYWRLAMTQFAMLYEDRCTVPKAENERAWTPPFLWTHSTRPPELGTPHRTRCPTAPTRITVLPRGRQKTPAPAHRKSDTPDAEQHGSTRNANSVAPYLAFVPCSSAFFRGPSIRSVFVRVLPWPKHSFRVRPCSSVSQKPFRTHPCSSAAQEFVPCSSVLFRV